MDNMFVNHLKDLSLKAQRTGRFTFTQFLSLDEISTLKESQRFLAPYTLFGGINGCERVVARFGSVDDLGYEQPFPIVCIKASPVLKKFADTLTHRDFLGALMNLGITRDNIGDIIVTENEAYIFVLEKLAEYITLNLSRVKHTVITASLCEAPPPQALFKTELRSIPVASLRLDCMLAGLYNLSRSQVTELFLAKKVFVNGKLTENISHVPKPGDTVSCRGFGRFIFSATGGTSKKGRIYIDLDVYV